MNKFQKQSPIFVIGMPRSGTTIISEAISVHEHLGWLSNYFKIFPNLPYVTVLSRILDLPKLGHFLRGKKKQDPSLTSFLRMFLPFCSEAYTVWNRYCVNNFGKDYLSGSSASITEKKAMRQVAQKVLKLQNKNRFFSKLTGPSRIQYINSIFPGSFFIHIIRDPRANISSLLKVKFWKKNHGYYKPWWENGLTKDSLSLWSYYDRNPVALCAVQWKEIIEKTWSEKQLLCKNKYIEIHYEDFVINPKESLINLFNYIDLPESEKVNLYVKTIGKVANMNFKYTENLSGKQIAIINEITNKTARKAGYSI